MRLLLSILALSAWTHGAHADIPVVDLDGAVHTVSAEHVVASLRAADAAGAPLLILRMNTPGGLGSSMREIVDAMLNGRTPVAVFVGPAGARAASAGFVIAVAADVAAMAPGTNMGAATPVSGLGGQMDEVMARKVTSDAAAYVRGKAERRGRNPELAEKAVTESLSFTEREALDAKLIDLVVADVPALIAALHGREITRFDGSRVTLALKGHATLPMAMTWRQSLLSFVARPDVMLFLLLGALAGLGTELSHPGLMFPGVVGALCLILFLYGSDVLPVNGAGVLLILLAILLFALEVKITSYGLLTVGGLTALIIGALMLFEAPVPELRLRLTMLVPLSVTVAAFTIALVRLVVQSQRRRATTGASGMLGLRGVADGDLERDGWVVVAGERWKAASATPLKAGERVIVTGVDGLLLNVRKED